jgi:DNA phosphorothioation-dependent restriction protein DptH
VAQEMVALALTQSHCAVAGEEGAPWFSLKDGFFVPLDDVPELFRPVGESKDRDASGQRADLLYVTAARRGGLKFSFVEVKFRRYLKTARVRPTCLSIIESQLDASCQRWEKLFGPDTTLLEKTVQRARLARVLRFYARKGQRHTLTDEAFECIDRELAKLAREGTGYALPALLDSSGPKWDFVFCPEYGGAKPVEIGTDIWLFGPVRLPETQRGEMFLGEGVGLIETVAAAPVTVQAEATAVEPLSQPDRPRP